MLKPKDPPRPTARSIDRSSAPDPIVGIGFQPSVQRTRSDSNERLREPLSKRTLGHRLRHIIKVLTDVRRSPRLCTLTRSRSRLLLKNSTTLFIQFMNISFNVLPKRTAARCCTGPPNARTVQSKVYAAGMISSCPALILSGSSRLLAFAIVMYFFASP